MKRKRNDYISNGFRNYALWSGLSGNTNPHASHLSTVKGMLIADAYQRLAHTPFDPEVFLAYGALKTEIHLQFIYITKVMQIKLEPWNRPGQPYHTSDALFHDLRVNGRMAYFTGGDMPTNHPLAAYVIPGLTYNDMFRAVHDVFGHAAEGYQFGPQGEYNAFRKHLRGFTPLAQRALATETLGQNCWVNFGPHMRRVLRLIEPGESGYLNPAFRPYAQQKAALLPRHILNQFIR